MAKHKKPSSVLMLQMSIHHDLLSLSHNSWRTFLPFLRAQCLFLHADTRLPNGFEQLIIDAVMHQQQQHNQPDPLRALQNCWQQFLHQQQPQQQAHHHPHQRQRQPSNITKWQSAQQPQQQCQQRMPPVSWGCFSSIQLDQVPFWQSWLLRVAVGLRTRVVHQPYGDQALFVRKSTLKELNVSGRQRLQSLPCAHHRQAPRSCYAPRTASTSHALQTLMVTE